MSKNNVSSDFERIETTIGELVEIITQIALETGKSESEGYELASMALESILRRQQDMRAIKNPLMLN